MLKRIELTNFMSHESTVIEPAPGLTVLTGPNNCGKSAVVAALQILCHNENSTYVLRHDEKECAVKVETDDGHVIEWRRRNAPSYTIDGKLFDRLRGAGLPEELHAALKLPKVDAGSEADFDVHFGTQKAPVFLLGSSAANAARFFASSSDAIRLVQMQKKHKEKLAAARNERNRLAEESTRLNDELERLEPVVELDARLTEVETQYEEVTRRRAWLAAGVQQESAMRRQAAVADEHQRRWEALRLLKAPPQLEDTLLLESLIAQLADAASVRARAGARSEALATLAVPPDQEATEILGRLILQLAHADHTHARTRHRAQATASVQPPPILNEDAHLQAMIDRVQAAARDVKHAQRRTSELERVASMPAMPELKSLAIFVDQFQRVSNEYAEREQARHLAEQKMEEVKRQLRSQATGAVCEACGAALDPERLLARAAAGLGGHHHDA